MTSELVRGHTLRGEGAPYNAHGQRDYYTPEEGRGKCSCGAISEPLRTSAARKRWHREHKDAVLAGKTLR